MEHPLIARLKWELRWRLAHASREFWLACVLLTASLAVTLLLAEPARLEAESDQREATRLMADESQRNNRQAVVAEDENRLGTFYRELPGSDALTTWLAALSEAADANGIPFHQGDYRYVLEKDARLGRYLVDLSLQGGYPALRGFIARILDTMPFAAVEGLTITRDDIASETVDVQIRIALYFSQPAERRP